MNLEDDIYIFSGHGARTNVTDSVLEQPFGEVVFSVTGEQCTVDQLIWEVLEKGSRAITNTTLFCFMLDCCR